MRLFVRTFIFVFVATVSNPVFATFLPQSEIAPVELLPVGAPNITKEQFDENIKYVSDIYSPIVTKHGARLRITGDWKSETINAGARQMFGIWDIVFTGGLARRPEMSSDGMVLILCHELGHHLGGFAMAPGISSPLPIPGTEAWAANEGQADYYATQVCSHKVWGQQKDENAKSRQTAPQNVKSYCDSVWSNIDQQNLCYRALVATQAISNTMAVLRKDAAMPNFDTPDASKSTETNHKHPATQCRMDTSFQGALCLADFNDEIIPGKKVADGVDSIAAEREAMINSCSSLTGFQIGLRPACWFKARL